MLNCIHPSAHGCLVDGISFQRAGVSLGLALMLTACSTGSAAQPSTPVVQTNAAPTPLAASTSPSTGSPLQIAQVQIRQNDTTIQIQNTGGSTAATAIDLSGWVLQVGTANVYCLAPRDCPRPKSGDSCAPGANGSPAPEPTRTTLSAPQTPIRRSMCTSERSDSNQVQVGDWVVAIGNALAFPGGLTVTQGVV
jgi:hypothetical protein